MPAPMGVSGEGGRNSHVEGLKDGVPRIRSVKPEHRQHRKVGPLSDRCYRLWMSMIAEADDDGRLVCDASQLRVITWSYHPKVTVGQVEHAIQEIAATGLIKLYTVDGIRYAWFPSWRDHQRPKYPTPSKLPEFRPSPNGSPGVEKDSPSAPPGLPEGSGVIPPGVGSRVVGSDLERFDREGRRGFGRGNPGQDFKFVLEQIRQRHPELSDAEAEAQAKDEVT